MKKYIVTGTSMQIEADSEEEAIARAQEMSGWHWEAEEDAAVRAGTDLTHRIFDLQAALERERDRSESLQGRLSTSEARLSGYVANSLVLNAKASRLDGEVARLQGEFDEIHRRVRYWKDRVTDMKASANKEVSRLIAEGRALAAERDEARAEAEAAGDTLTYALQMLDDEQRQRVAGFYDGVKQ